MVEAEKKERKTKDTPKEIIDRMNETHQDWKKYKQVKYDMDGKRLPDDNQD